MNEKTFDALTREAGGGVSRRHSLTALGGAGLAALLAAPLAADGKSKNKNKNKKNRKRRRTKAVPECPPHVVAPECPPLTEDCSSEIAETCTRQKDECNALFATLCQDEGAPEDCIEETGVCCELLGDCQAAAFIDCFLRIVRGGPPEPQ